jgi:hypothetical protein
MNAHSIARLREIFGQAQQLKAAVDRERYPAAACQGDLELRQQIDSLLMAHEQAGVSQRTPILQASMSKAI